MASVLDRLARVSEEGRHNVGDGFGSTDPPTVGSSSPQSSVPLIPHRQRRPSLAQVAAVTRAVGGVHNHTHHHHHHHYHGPGGAGGADHHADGPSTLAGGTKNKDLQRSANVHKTADEKNGSAKKRKAETAADLKQRLLESFFYLFFLANFMVVVVMQRDPIYYTAMNSYMKDLFLYEEFPGIEIYKTFFDVATVSEFWEYMHGPVAAGLFDVENERYIYGTNRVLGGIRIRQFRVDPVDCRLLTSEDYSTVGETCYPPYDTSHQSTSDFGTGGRVFAFSEDDGFTSEKARIEFYGGGSHVVDLAGATNYTAALDAFKALEDDGFVDLATRAVFVDWVTFNPNINAFSTNRLGFEFLPSGGVLPGYEFNILSIMKHEGPRGHVLLVSEIILVLQILFYTVEETREMVSSGRSYITDDMWNAIDSTNNFLFIVTIAFRVALFFRFRALDLPSELEGIASSVDGGGGDGSGGLTSPDLFLNVQRLIFLHDSINMMLGINAILLWIKIFKYSTFFLRTQLIISVIKIALVDIVVFIAMFFIVLSGFATGGYIIFGIHVAGFDRPDSALLTLFKYTLGDFNLEDITYNFRLLGPVYFFVFVVVVAFIVLSMFISIINDSYYQAREEAEREAAEQPRVLDLMVAVMRRKYRKNLKKEMHTIDAIKDRVAKDDAPLTRDRVYEHLSNSPLYTQAEIDALFTRIDSDGNEVLDSDEKEMLFDDLARRKEEYIAKMQREFASELPPEVTPEALEELGGLDGLLGDDGSLEGLMGGGWGECAMSEELEIEIEHFRISLENLERKLNRHIADSRAETDRRLREMETRIGTMLTAQFTALGEAMGHANVGAAAAAAAAAVRDQDDGAGFRVLARAQDSLPDITVTPAHALAAPGSPENLSEYSSASSMMPSSGSQSSSSSAI